MIRHQLAKNLFCVVVLCLLPTISLADNGQLQYTLLQSNHTPQTEDLDALEDHLWEHPEVVEGCYEIKKFEKIPRLASTTEFVRKVLL